MNGSSFHYVLFSTKCGLFNDVIINSDLVAARDRMIEYVEFGRVLIQEIAA